MKEELILSLLLKAKASLEADYQSQMDEVNWFNNNTPNVGKTIDYKVYLPIPVALSYIDEAIEKLSE